MRYVSAVLTDRPQRSPAKQASFVHMTPMAPGSPGPPARARWPVIGMCVIGMVTAIVAGGVTILDSSADDSVFSSAQKKGDPVETGEPEESRPVAAIPCPGADASRPMPCFPIRDFEQQIVRPLEAKGYSCDLERPERPRCQTDSRNLHSAVAFTPPYTSGVQDTNGGIDHASLTGYSGGFSGEGASLDKAWSQLQRAAEDTIPLLLPELEDAQREVIDWLNQNRDLCLDQDRVDHSTGAGLTLKCGKGTQVELSGPKGTVTSWSPYLDVRVSSAALSDTQSAPGGQPTF